jgi:hypothetical protein
MLTGIQRLRDAYLSQQVTCVRIAAEAGLPVSTVHDVMRNPEIDMRISTVQGLERAATSILGPDREADKATARKLAGKMGMTQQAIDKWTR